ncbi:unnamed protein product, partial [Closterium sp. NIES-53]
ADLVAHLRTSDARYRAALPTEFCAKNPPPPIYINLYYLVTRLPDSLSSIKDHFLSLCPTKLTVHRARGAPCCVGDAATARAGGARVVEGAAGEATEDVEEAEEVAVEVGVVPGVGASVALVEVVAEVAEVAEAAAAVVEVAAAVVLVEVQPCSVKVLVSASASSSRAPVRPCRSSSFVSGTLGVGGLGVQVPALTFSAPAVVMGRSNVPIFDLDFDAILAAMYAFADNAEGACYLSVLPDPDIAAAALGACASTAPGTGASAAPGAGASRSFFRKSTTLTPLSRPVAVSLADPSGGPVIAHSSTVLPCPAAPSGLLSGLHLPSFSTNLVSGADLQDAWVDQFTSGGFAAASRSSLVSAPCSCRPLSHETLLWHHRLGHPSLPRLRGMASRALVSGLPRSLPPLPPGPSPTCVPCVEGRQHAAPHSSSFPPTEAPLQTLHMDVWGPARVRGQGHKRYFLLVVDDYSRYTTVFPLRSKDRGGEFSSDLLRAFCRSEGICETFTLPASPQQNGIAERRIGMYAAHQINLQPRVFVPETTPTLRWTGKVGDASAFRVWGSRAFVRDTTVDKLSSCAIPCVFLGFPLDAPGWQFYHPTSGRVVSSQDVRFDESVSYYHPVEPVEVAVDLGATRSAEPAGAGTGGAEPGVSVSEGAEPRVAEPGRVEPEGIAPGGAEPLRAESGGALGVPSGREPLSSQQLREWYSRHCRGATGAGGAARAAGGATGGGAAAGGVAGAGGAARAAGGAGGAAGPAGGAAASGAGGAAGAAGGAAGAGANAGAAGGSGAAGADGAAGAGAAARGAAGTGAAGGAPGAGGVAGAGAAAGAAGGAAAGGAAGAAGGAAGTGGAAGAGAPGAAGGVAWLRPYYVPLLQQVLGFPPSLGPPPPFLIPPPVQSQSHLQPTSPLPGPSPYSGPTSGPTERREPEWRLVSPESRSASPFRTVDTACHSASSLPVGPDPESGSLRAASPSVTRFLATAVTDPLFESTPASALVTELVDFAAACRLDYATSLVAESASVSVCPPSVGGECALGTDVLEDRQEDFECFAAASPHLVSMLLAPEGDPDALDIPTLHS